MLKYTSKPSYLNIVRIGQLFNKSVVKHGYKSFKIKNCVI